MSGPGIIGLFLGLFLLAGLIAWSSWKSNSRRLARIRADWGRPRNRRRDLEAIADLFECHDAASESIDDRTWHDLLLDDVFAALDRTESSVGQQMLYRRLRSAPAPRALSAFEALVTRAASGSRIREHAQLALARLSDSSAYFLHRPTRPDTVDTRPWHVLFPIWTTVVLLGLALVFIWPPLFLFVLAALVANLTIRIATGRRVGGEIAWFRQVGPLLSAASALAPGFDGEDTATITGTLRTDLRALGRLGAIARWVSRDPLTTGEPVGVMLEYLNLALLMDVNALFFAGRELRSHAPHLLRVIESVGEIDAAIAVASYRASGHGWARPVFVAPGNSAVAVDLRHPLIQAAEPNSMVLAPPHGLLITGSNMSGKSTFLRTVGVNAVMAQAINTALATSYAAPVYHVRSCIGRADDLIAGKSYYLVEIQSVLSLVSASGRSEPHLFLFDELFRGTNAVERVSAAEAVLRELASGGRSHVVLATTHDADLVEYLQDCYAVCHLGDAIGPDGLVFDYHIVPGPATTRNAIALLELSGAPESIVTAARARAAGLVRERPEPKVALPDRMPSKFDE